MASAAASLPINDADADDGELRRIQVCVRVKPLAAEQKEAGAACTKRIARWDDSSVTVAKDTAAGEKSFFYPHLVLPPAADQAAVAAALAPRLVNAFVKGFDVNFLAFGQTGSGKTHSVLGPPGSMARLAAQLGKGKGGATASATDASKGKAAFYVSPADVDVDAGAGDGDGAEKSCSSGSSVVVQLAPGHGLFLRAAFSALDAVRARAAGGVAAGHLTGSMVELYFDSILDLLNDKTPCSLDERHQLAGALQRPLTCREDVLRLATAAESRTQNATLMNESSSRTHCIVTLTLTQRALDGSDAVTTSRLCFVDMMGSERSKGQNSAQDVSKNNKDFRVCARTHIRTYTLTRTSAHTANFLTHSPLLPTERRTA
jgi:kinesin family protein 4/21/27